MIFFHTENNEYSTDLVVQYYLRNGGRNFCRHNETDALDNFSLELNNTEDDINFLTRDGSYELDGNVKVFYRRGGMIFNSSFATVDFEKPDVNQFVTNELKALVDYTCISLHNRANGFGSYFEEMTTNKLVQLSEARSAGLKIPVTLITNDKDKLIQFRKMHGELIFKPITDHPGIAKDNIFISPQGTKMVTDEFVDYLDDHFFPTLFQEAVQKKIEIRSFYFDNQFYSAAIFSQSNEKTSLDFRNYDNEKQNRLVPFRLPAMIEDKLREVYRKLNLDTGSADLILTESDEYVFLEINALGQFAWVSETCNYHIEKKLANYLWKQEN